MRNFLIIAIMALTVQLRAQTGTSEAAPTYKGQPLPQGWMGFAALSSGYTANNNDIAVEGVPSSIKLMGSYYLKNYKGVFDLGFGAHTQTFNEKTARDSSLSTTIFEAAARYQFENRWQLGAVYDQFFDRGRNYFSNQADALFGGIQVLKEFTIGGNTDMRVGLRAMTDLNTNDEAVNIAQLDLAFGWGNR